MPSGMGTRTTAIAQAPSGAKDRWWACFRGQRLLSPLLGLGPENLHATFAYIAGHHRSYEQCRVGGGRRQKLRAVVKSLGSRYSDGRPGSVGPSRTSRRNTHDPMDITLNLPRILQQYCHGQPELRLRGATVRAVLEALQHEYPALYRCICNETGTVRPHINLFLNNDLLHRRNGLDTRLEAGHVLSVFQAVSGG